MRRMQNGRSQQDVRANRRPQMVSFAMELGSEETTIEVRAEAFLDKLVVERQGGFCVIQVGPLLKLKVPRQVEKELLLDLAAMVGQEEAAEVMSSLESRT